MIVECTAYRVACAAQRQYKADWQEQSAGYVALLNKYHDFTRRLPPGVLPEEIDPVLHAEMSRASAACNAHHADCTMANARIMASQKDALTAIGQHFGRHLSAALAQVAPPSFTERYGEYLIEALAPTIAEWWTQANLFRQVNLDGRNIAPGYDTAGPMFKAFVKESGRTLAEITKALDSVTELANN